MGRGWKNDDEEKNRNFILDVEDAMRRNNVPREKIAKAAGFKDKTFFNRKNHPEEMKVKELRAYVRLCGLSEETVKNFCM